MREVFLVAAENKSKAEDLLRRDDEVSRGSITLKSPGSLDMDEEGYFIIIDASDERIKKAEHLLHGLATKYSHQEKVLEKIDEQENSAIEGFGSILG